MESLFLFLWVAAGGLQAAQAQAKVSDAPFPFPEKLTYNVEWRLMDAGTATVDLQRSGMERGWNLNFRIESAGLVSRLYRVMDMYQVSTLDGFCLGNATLDSQEGKRHSQSKMVADNSAHRLRYEEHDLLKNQTTKKEWEIAPCTYEILGALAALRTMNLEPGKSRVLPITDGRKFAQARIEAQAKEEVSAGGKKYSTTRYEGFLFDNVLYKRHGRLLIWVENGPSHMPVVFRLLLGFPIGTITVELQKQEK